MHDPYAPPWAHSPYDWEPRRRRRLNSTGVTVLLVLFAILCALFLVALKVGLIVWQAPETAKALESVQRVAPIAADAALEHYGVPERLRDAVEQEASVLSGEGPAPEAANALAHQPR